MSKLLFSGLTGSRLYGCATTNSDMDIYEVVVEPFEGFILHGPAKTLHHIDNIRGEDVTITSLAKFVNQLKKASPSATPLLWHPKPKYTHPLWETLLEAKDALISTQTLKTFFAAGVSQAATGFRKEDPKMYATSYRWLSEVVFFAQHHAFKYPIEEETLDEYLALKNEIFDIGTVKKVLAEIEAKAHKAIERSDLPDAINTKKLDAATIKIYKEVFSNEF